MRLLEFVTPDGETVYLNCDSVVRIRVPRPAEFHGSVGAVIELSGGKQAVREAPEAVVMRLNDRA